MKKIIIAVIAMVSTMAFAQTELTYGIRGGVNASKIKDVHGSSDQRIGFHLGGFAQIPLQANSQEFYFQPELLYMMLGEKNGEKNVNLDYLAVPILFKAYFSERDTEFFGEIGPQLGFLVNKSLPDNYGYDHEFNSVDLGITLGLGFSYLRNWEASLRFYYGFSDVIKNDALNATNFNSNFNLGVAYRF